MQGTHSCSPTRVSFICLVFLRLLGLIGFVETKCDNPQALHYRSEDLDWPHFVFVAVVVTLYWFLATEIRYDNKDQVGNVEKNTCM